MHGTTIKNNILKLDRNCWLVGQPHDKTRTHGYKNSVRVYVKHTFLTAV